MVLNPKEQTVLSLKEQAVLSAKCIFTEEKKALAWITDKGFKISHSEYYKILKKINANTQARMFEISKNYKAEHLNSLHKLYHIENELWAMFYSKKTMIKMVKVDVEGTDKSGNPFHKVSSEPKEFLVEIDNKEKREILKQITEHQLYLAAFREAAQLIQENSIVELAKVVEVKPKALV